MDEGRKRVLGIVAGILVTRHPKTTDDLTDDLFDICYSPRTTGMKTPTRSSTCLRIHKIAVRAETITPGGGPPNGKKKIKKKRFPPLRPNECPNTGGMV